MTVIEIDPGLLDPMGFGWETRVLVAREVRPDRTAARRWYAEETDGPYARWVDVSCHATAIRRARDVDEITWDGGLEDGAVECAPGEPGSVPAWRLEWTR